MSGYYVTPAQFWMRVREQLAHFSRVVRPWWRPTVIRDGESYREFKQRADAIRAGRQHTAEGEKS